MNHALCDAMGWRSLFEFAFSDETLNFFVELKINVIIPAHWEPPYRLRES